MGGDPKSRAEKKAKKEKENLDNDIVEDEAHSESLLETLKALTPKGFEPAYRKAGASANACSPRSASTISRSPAAQAIGIDGIRRFRLNDLEPVSTFPFGLREGL